MDELSKKLGPLPLWGWAVAAVAAYLVFTWWRDRSKTTTAAPATTVTGYTGARTMGQFVTSTGHVLTPTTGNIIGNTGTGSSGNLTGETWINKAQLALLNLGYSPATIASALQAYASGSALNQTQYNIVTAAEKLIGAGPFGGPSSPTQPTPKPVTTKTPILGVFQAAPTNNVWSATGKIFSPIATWQKTLTLISHGVAVYLKTTVTGQAYKVSSVTELKAIENTGNHAFTQYTTYTEATSPSGSPTFGAILGGSGNPVHAMITTGPAVDLGPPVTIANGSNPLVKVADKTTGSGTGFRVLAPTGNVTVPNSIAGGGQPTGAVGSIVGGNYIEGYNQYGAIKTNYTPTTGKNTTGFTLAKANSHRSRPTGPIP